MALGVRNRVLLFLLVRLLFFAPKIGLKSWFSRLLGLIIVGSFLLSAARYDVRYGEGSHSHNKARTLPSSFRSLRSICLNRKNRFSEVNGVQPFQFEPTILLAKNQSILRMKVSQVIEINEIREEESAAPNGALAKSASQ